MSKRADLRARLKSLASRVGIKRNLKGNAVPRVSSMSYQGAHDWYAPLLCSASQLRGRLSGGAVVRKVMGVLERLEQDSYSEFVLDFYQQGLARFGDEWDYADINTTLLGLSAAIGISSYLEIGVRKGRSMAMVASQSPACSIVGFDLWLPNYSGMPNPGKEFVKQELESVGFNGTLSFVDGDSKHTVPRYFRDHSDAYFDVITVDGDHSTAGATRDLTNVIPRLKAGGALVFDDIAHAHHSSLGKVWHDVIVSNPRFSTFTYSDLGFGVGLGLRKF
jgi:hypothetical protein